ncbi:DUF397 domain-containing protein [Sphaerisporangium sp. NPDC051017]|uniref:DUF397 domain-containing protein n=1 Tax=Sphaerisporangium sp. NPDC051017 TaxID=3154636 RepID=UPI003426E2CC
MITNRDLDVSQAVWQKSTYSQGQGNNCVEVAKVKAHVVIRDSKTLAGTALIVQRREWCVFLSEIKQG